MIDLHISHKTNQVEVNYPACKAFITGDTKVGDGDVSNSETQIKTSCHRKLILFMLFIYQIMLDHLLESSLRDDSNKWSNIEFGQEIGIIDVKNLSGVLIRSLYKTFNPLSDKTCINS